MTSPRDALGGAVSTAVSDVLDRPATGRVVHVGPSTVGVEVSGRLLVLDEAGGPATLPCAVLVSGPPPARVGEAVRVEPTGLRAVGWAVRVERWWQPARVRSTSSAAVPEPDADGSGLPVTVEAVLRRAADALLGDDVDAAAAALVAVLGLGPGSTPQADDAVAGWLLGARVATVQPWLQRWAQPDGDHHPHSASTTAGSGAAPGTATGAATAAATVAVDEVGRRIAEAAPGRTTLLSAELLRHAAHGIAARAVVRFVQHPSRAHRVAVLGLGGTSGAATVAGVELARTLLETSGAAA